MLENIPGIGKDLKAKREAELKENEIDEALVAIDDYRSQLQEMSGGPAAEEEINEILGEADDEVLGIKDEPRIKKVMNELRTLANKKLKEKPKPVDVSKDKDKIKDFYRRFANAYSGGNAGAVTSMLSDSWTSSDGASAGDVEQALGDAFDNFDQVKCKITGVNIRPLDDGTFEVTYSSKITGVISEYGIKHEESSNVTEIVGYEDGQLRILKTTSR
ncbi:hypothetical protein ACFL5C_01665, partial [Candidatus Omnitrophota bacterium]